MRRSLHPFRIALLWVGGIACAGCGVRYGVAPNDSKVVFLGDSITQYWSSYADFEAEGWINKGISGQTSAQIAARFQTDVIALHPQAVHILAGTNDLTAQWVPQQTWDAYTQMLTAAHEAGIHVLMGTIPPWGLGQGAGCDRGGGAAEPARPEGQRLDTIANRCHGGRLRCPAGREQRVLSARSDTGWHPPRRARVPEMTPSAAIAILGWRGAEDSATACANPAVVLRLPGL